MVLVSNGATNDTILAGKAIFLIFYPYPYFRAFLGAGQVLFKTSKSSILLSRNSKKEIK
jgi:hypothetical protein